MTTYYCPNMKEPLRPAQIENIKRQSLFTGLDGDADNQCNDVYDEAAGKWNQTLFYTHINNTRSGVTHNLHNIIGPNQPDRYPQEAQGQGEEANPFYPATNRAIGNIADDANDQGDDIDDDAVHR